MPKSVWSARPGERAGCREAQAEAPSPGDRYGRKRGCFIQAKAARLRCWERCRPAISATALAVAVLSLTASPAWAYPVKPVRIIVPYAPGGPTDALARIVGAELATRWGQSVLVENRPGANAVIGAGVAASAAPDGYTLFEGTLSTHGINPFVYKKVPYDPVRDFTPIVPLSKSVLYLAVSNRVPVSNVQEFLAYVRQRPGQVNFGSIGPGSAHQITGELLQRAAGLKMTEVAYKGTGPAMTALTAGEIDALFDASAMQHAKAGRVKVLAVTSRERWPLTPEVPTMAEQGVQGLDPPNGWFGLFAPAGVTSEIVQKVNRDVNEALRNPEVQKKLATIGHVPTGGTPEALREEVRASLKYGEKISAELKLKLD
jgi:tripartite-type tricarboxylate transporter receptor subunit TctC